MPLKTIQLGKNGVTEGFIETLKKQFQNTENIKVNVLKNYCRDRQELEDTKEKILEALGKNYTAKTIGYTIALKKHNKKVR